MRNNYRQQSPSTKAQAVNARQMMLILALGFVTFCMFVQIAHSFL